MILPNLDATATAAYAASPDTQILANTSAVQAVRENTLGITAAHFWNDASTTAGTITSDHKAAVMLRRTSTNLDIAVSDPTWKNVTSINLIITGRALAYIRGRSYVLPQDIVDMALDVMRHRLVLSYEAMADAVTSDMILQRVLETIPVPEPPLETHANIDAKS